jgi:Site-specific recombinase XerD
MVKTAKLETNGITSECISGFAAHLRRREKAARTIDAYVRTIRSLVEFLSGTELTQDAAVRWKSHISQRLQPTSVNAAIAAVNAYAKYRRLDVRLKRLKIQPRDELPAAKTLTPREIDKLLKAASMTRLFFILRTFIMLGIRVGELRFITVEALRRGEVCITNKGKTRIIPLPKLLLKELKAYAKKNEITDGHVFVTRAGNAVDPKNIWRELKQLAFRAGVDTRKVFPHNLRHYFALSFYRSHRDIDTLARILGHSNVNTTRIYIADTGKKVRRGLEKLSKLHAASYAI